MPWEGKPIEAGKNSLLSCRNSPLAHITHIRALFNLFYPNVIPSKIYENVYEIYENFVFDPGEIGNVIGSYMSEAVQIAEIDQVYINWDPLDPAELVESIVTALAFNVNGIEDVLDRTQGHIPVGNSDT